MTILIVDDHAVVRSGLVRLFEGHDVREAVDAQSAMTSIRSETPDLVVLDLNLPDGGGFELIRRLVRERPSVKILVLSMHGQPVYAMRALECGAKGYVSKAASPGELIEAVRAIETGRRYVEARIAQEMVANEGQGGLENLSGRELHILAMLAEGRSLNEIASAVGVAYKTIANGCTQLKAKLGAASSAELIKIGLELRGRDTSGVSISDREPRGGA